MDRFKKTEILLLGSFHFFEQNDIDFYSAKIQGELQELVYKLSKFNPDKIIIEAPIHSQQTITETYASISLEDFSNYEKMKTSLLGYINFAGDKYPITYNNESIQIGFRLAKMLKKDNVYAIDYITLSENNTILEIAQKEIPGWAKINSEFRDSFNNDASKIKETGTITDLYKYFNGDWSLKQHSIWYLLPNQLGAGKDYIGSEYLSRWYERNIKIFANLQKVSAGCERVFVLYGAGHLPIFMNLISQCEDMKLVNVFDYL